MRGDVNKSFGKYELAERIGKGGMAEVFLAKSVGARGVEKTLVIKKILPELAQNERFIEMFIAEAKIAMGLNHPNIVQIYDFGRVDTDYYLAMEYVDGFELGRLLGASQRVKKGLPIGDAIYLAMEAARGLDYAHRRADSYGRSLELVHCDISPQNILVSRDGALKIVDFGIAKATSIADDGPDVVKGKYQYMSPEQAVGEDLDHRSDLFSLGAVLFEMVCGRGLFSGSTPDETVSLVTSAVVPDIKAINPAVPDQLEHLIYKALARDRDERVQNAREFQLELTRVLYGLSDIHDATTVAHHIQDVETLLPDNSLEFMIAADPDMEFQTVRTRARTHNSGGTPQLPSGRTPLLEDAALHTGLSRQRKEVVILIGQLGGLGTHEDGESGHQLVAAYQRILESIAYKSDAAVHQLDSEGFAILLGIPISSENDAERAARMALDIQEAIEGMSVVLDPPLTIRQGITMGEVILKHDMDHSERHYEWSFHGQGKEQAGQLAKEAGARQVWIGEQVYQRLRRNFRCKVSRDNGADPWTNSYRMLGPKSTKDQINEMIKMRLDLRCRLSEDAADALAVAVCHSQSIGFDQRLKKA